MYDLLAASAFKRDIDALDPSLYDLLVDKLRFLEHDPAHASLRSEKVKSMGGIWRSWLNDYYRLYWFYRPEHRGEIVLWRAGPRTWTDRLRHSALPDQGQLMPFRRSVPRQVRSEDPKGFFAQVHRNHLILLGVPEDKVDDVKELDDIDSIFDLGLPHCAEQILIDLYTSGWWGTEQLVSSELIFYRANADEIESYCKGKTTKLLLDLHPAQRELAYMSTTGPLLVKGVAGSGKTTVGLYRALHLVEQRTLFSDRPRILFVTYNETLAIALEQLFSELRGPEIRDSIEVTTLRDWAMGFLHVNESQIAGKRQRGKCLTDGIKSARKQYPDTKPMHLRGSKFFAAEIADVIKGRGISRFHEYDGIDRTARDKGLRRGRLRQFVWHVYQTYQEELDSLDLYDYEQLALSALEELGTSGPALYDAVIVDEAQDLRPIEIQLVARLAGGRESPRLTLLADPQQSIYYKGVSWREAGVEIVGRSRALSRNFRNTRQILDAAWSLAERGLQDESDVVSPDAVSRQGPRPVVIQKDSFRSQLQEATEIILELCQSQQYNPGDLAVLAHDRDDVRAVHSCLRAANIPVVHYREAGFDIREYQVKAITMHSAKGLEWPIVIVVGLEGNKLPRRLSANLDDDERASEMAQDRKLLYVAMTRAMERLYLLTSPPTSSFLEEIDQELVVRRK